MPYESIVGRFVAVVDDDHTNAFALAEAIRRRRHWDAIPFTSARLALRYCDIRQPALALLDFSMPEMNGVTLAEQLRIRHPDLPVAFITASPDHEDFVRLRRDLAMPRATLEKPSGLAVILRELDRLLASA